jgi:hypothetical protein
MAWKRTFIGVGNQPDEPWDDKTKVSREDSMVKPSLYPKMMEIMKDWLE